MSTIIIQHDDCLRHDPGAKHPESVQRVKAVMSGLEGLRGLQKLPAPLATIEQITRVHPAEFWAGLQSQEPTKGVVTIAPDTLLNPGSIDATLRGSGGMCFAIDQVLDDKALRAFCVVRPPGHHSEPEQAMGFCLLNHVAIGALHALERSTIKRVAIIDFDVHHGNGTQAAFWEDPRALTISVHQDNCFPPDSGPIEDNGAGPGEGYNINIPLPPGSGTGAYDAVFDRVVVPALKAYRPQLIMVPSGFSDMQYGP